MCWALVILGCPWITRVREPFPSKKRHSQPHQGAGGLSAGMCQHVRSLSGGAHVTCAAFLHLLDFFCLKCTVMSVQFLISSSPGRCPRSQEARRQRSTAGRVPGVSVHHPKVNMDCLGFLWGAFFRVKFSFAAVFHCVDGKIIWRSLAVYSVTLTHVASFLAAPAKISPL